jgi:hypothetical protein
MDLWNLFLKRAFSIPSLDYCMLGRWISLECPVGWIAHYGIGVVFAVVFVSFASPGWLAHPTVLPALVYGIGTVVFPFFLLQPSLGLGIAGSRTANPMQARVKSLATHTVFGIGLYLSALGVSYLLGARLLAFSTAT